MTITDLPSRGKLTGMSRDTAGTAREARQPKAARRVFWPRIFLRGLRRHNARSLRALTAPEHTPLCVGEGLHCASWRAHGGGESVGK